jgi:hypothetical protein
MAFSQISSFSSILCKRANTPDISTTSLNYWYKFNSGDIVNNRLYNYATSTYDATVYNSPSFNTSTYKTGSSSLYLNGSSNQYIDIDDFTSSTSGITIACWFKTSSSDWARIFDFGNGSASNNILFSPNNGPSVYRGTVQITQPGSVGTYADNNWNHLIWTLSASSGSTCTWNIYINGSNKYNNTSAGYPSVVSRVNNYIGYSNWPIDGYTTGYFDDFRYYSREISSSEVTQLYNHTK